MALLDGKVAIVTGAGHGIGRAHALELAKHGASVVVNDLGTSVTGDGADEKAADLTVELITQRGGAAVASYDDVSDYEAAGRMVQQAIDTYGKLDVLVNNAGIVRDGGDLEHERGRLRRGDQGAREGHLGAVAPRRPALARSGQGRRGLHRSRHHSTGTSHLRPWRVSGAGNERSRPEADTSDWSGVSTSVWFLYVAVTARAAGSSRI